MNLVGNIPAFEPQRPEAEIQNGVGPVCGVDAEESFDGVAADAAGGTDVPAVAAGDDEAAVDE
jgi:hypothetical protein